MSLFSVPGAHRAQRHLAMIAVVTLGCVGSTAQQETGARAATVRWDPDGPQQGSFVFVVVTPSPTDALRENLTVLGTLAGQTLHFERDRAGHFRAIGAVPVGASETIPIPYSIVADGDTTHGVARLPVAEGDYLMERLTVAPRFSAAPDSALQARTRAETAMSRAVTDRSHNKPRMWHGEWVRPRPGRVTSAFGTGRVFNGQIQSRHSGTDFDGNLGDPIRAGNRGEVALVGDFYYAGNVVYLDHGAGLVTIYMHMSAVDVQEGDIVEKGDIIGRVGATGRVTGPHLHWTGRYGRVNVEPLTIFDLDPTALAPPVTDSVTTQQDQ